jgi:3D (Asp-Asp-Asp) domain-containing protein
MFKYHNMFNFLRAITFAVVTLIGVAVLYPISASTFAPVPIVRRVTVIDNGVTAQFETTTNTVGAFLYANDIVVHPADEISHLPRIRIRDDMTISIYRGVIVDVYVDGESEIFRVPRGKTVGEKLSLIQFNTDMALVYDGDLSSPIRDGYPVIFRTWRSEMETNFEVLPYYIEVVNTPSLSLGVDRVRQAGVLGQRHTEEMVIFVGGAEYAREIMEEHVTEPINKIIDRGVGGDLGTMTDTSCPSFRYVRRVVMNASAYTSGFSCTGKHPWDPWYGITASGRRVQRGIVAVDPAVIPLGTRLYVDGYGFSIAADVGGGIRGYMIDLFMYSLEEARQFGRRNIYVWILE